MSAPEQDAGVQAIPIPRRRFLKLSGAAVAVSAAAAEGSAAKAFAALPADGFDEFMKFSTFLTEKTGLDEGLGRKIYQGLTGTDPDFSADMRRLAAELEASPLPLKGLQEALDKKDEKLARIPRNIMKAWYLGVVGTGAEAYAVAYEETLMFAPVADVVVLPSFARGVPKYWEKEPDVFQKSGGK